MTDQSEPKEPSNDYRIVWMHGLRSIRAWELKQIVGWKGNEWLREYLYPDERALRERKRGEPPTNPYPFTKQPAIDWANGFRRAVEWCDSGESDEIAKLREELADCKDALRDRQLRVAELEENVDLRCARIAELESANKSLGDMTLRVQGELAEAREELRLLGEVEALARKPYYYSFSKELAAIDAHRAKPSPQSPSRYRVGRKVPNNLYLGDKGIGRCDTPELAAEIVAAANQSPSGADRGAPSGRCCARGDFGESHACEKSPPYETAPTLEKGVRYRVVDAAMVPVSTAHEWPIGRVFEANGEEQKTHVPGWYKLGDNTGLHRVVRVESAPVADGPPLPTPINDHKATLAEPRLMGPLEDRVRRLEEWAESVPARAGLVTFKAKR